MRPSRRPHPDPDRIYPEKVLSPAIRLDGETIIEGPMHLVAIEKAADQGLLTSYGINGFDDLAVFLQGDVDLEDLNIEDGFTTTYGRFIDREEARDIAMAQIQVPKDYGRPGLDSADLLMGRELFKPRQLAHVESTESEWVSLARQAKQAELNRNLDLRNELARQLFSRRKNRELQVGDKIVRTWWDPISRNYITITLDQEGNQLGNADTTGNSGSAAIAHLWALQAAMASLQESDEEDMMWRVVWADGRAVQFFDNPRAAFNFYHMPRRDASRPTLTRRPKGARVKSVCPKS